MALNQQDSRIPVYRSGIPLARGGHRGRQTTQLPVRAGTRPTALSGLTAHWPTPSERQPSSASSSANSTPSDSAAAPNRIPVQQQQPLPLPLELSVAHLGREVIVGGTKRGILRFFGEIPFDSGLFCGVELHQPEGLNDGSVRGIKLFDCEPLHGVLAPLRKVSLLPVSPAALVGCRQQLRSPTPTVPATQLPVAQPNPASLLPPGVKRQRTNAYESEAAASSSSAVSPVLPPPDVLEEDEVSTPREEVAGEGSTEERWSSEEVTPGAEQSDRAAPSLLRPVTVGEKRDTPKEGHEIVVEAKYRKKGFDLKTLAGMLEKTEIVLEIMLESKPTSLSSFPSPITERTLEWTSGKSSGSSGSFLKGALPHHPRSISDGSIVEMAGVVSTSTPAPAGGGGPLSTRCGRRGPSGSGGSAAPGISGGGIRQQQSSQQQQSSHCSSECVFAVHQRSGDEGHAGVQHCGETCTCGRAFSKHSSFEMDESLGILTPDQMIDFTVCMEGCGRTPTFDDAFEVGVAFPSEHFGRPAEGPGRKGLVQEGGYPEGLEALSPAEADEPRAGAESPGLPTPPGELTEAVEEEEGVGGGEGQAMEGAVEEAPGAMEGHSDEEARMDDEEEQEVKDVMGEPCVTDAPSSISNGPSTKSAQVAPCFVASVTSITSIDPGYQGDGEWSRPASRADNSPGSSAPPGIGANFGIPVDVLKLKIDAMTDSDFYSDTGAGGTESDADHEEAMREGAMAPGDRRAQVIDGTLYGGMGGQHGGGAGGGLCGSSHQQPPPRCFAAVMTSSTATTTEEMESSGVFSDLDRRADVRIPYHSQALPRPSSAQGVSSSAAESSDVPQSPLEELPEDPKKDSTYVMAKLEDGGGKVAGVDSEDGADMRDVMDVTLAEGEKMDTSSPPAEVAEDFSALEQQDTATSMSCDASMERTFAVDAGPMSPLSRPNDPSAGGNDQQQPQLEQPPAEQQQQKPNKQQQEQQQLPGHGTKQKSPGNAVNVSPPKKHKMPKRNVASKIKAMIESSPTAKEDGSRGGEEGEGSGRRQTSQRPGRWDAIMSKIAEGKAEQRTSRPRLREVKSRVMASIGTPPTTGRNSTTNEEGREAGGSRAKKTFISNATRARRGETRRARARALDMSSLRDATCGAGTAAPPGEVGDSLNPSVHSSMSDVSVSRGASVAKPSNSSRSSKKREADRSASPFSDGSSNSGASNIPRPMRPHLGAIPRQPTHPPQRERARDKTANSNALTTASSTSSSSAAVLKRNQRTSHLTSSATPSPKRVNTGHRRAQTVEKGTTTEMKAPSARKTGTRHLPSGAQVQKPAQLRDNNRLGGGVVSKNGGPANNHGSSTRGNAVVLLQRQHIQLATVEAPTPEAMVETAKSPTPKGPPPVPPKLLEELKQSATRIEALLVLIQYLVVDLDAFSTPSLKKAVEEYKTEAINTKLNLDEAVASCQRLAEEEKISEVRHKENIDELIRKNGENLAELEARLTSQVEETQCRYEEELKRRDRLNNRNMEALLEDLKLYAERAEKAEKEVESEEKQVENLKKEKEEILARENDLKQLSSRLQSEITDLVEKLRKENVIKAGDCGKHRDEIQSLQAVLDLRTKELHDHRKKTEEYRQKSEALNSALARNAALQARVEDLEAQLQRKVSTERKLQERVRHLSENVERECRQNEQLALENEVLEWKINESSKLMSSFSGQSDMSSSMTGSMMASSSPSSDRRSISTMAISLGSPDSPPNFMFSRFSPRLSPKSPFSDVSGTIELEEEEEEEEEDDMEGDEEEDEEEEIKVGAGGLEEEEEEEDDKLSIEPTPITPKVRTLVEKNESISWLVEMEEVIPASSLSSHIQSAGMRRAHGSPQSTPLNLLPQMIPELPPVANSPSTSPTSSDPSSNIFRGKGGSPPHSARRVAMPPAKKTRPERGKLAGHGMMYASTPLKTSMTHGHHHRHHGRYHHQPRSTSRLPPSDSPLCSARSRSVSTDSESLDAEEASAAANARLAELKAWRGGKSAGERVPSAPGPQDTVPTAGGDSEEGGKKDGPGEKGDWDMNGRECGDGFDSKFPVDDGSRLSEDGFRVGGSSPRSKPPTPMEDKNSPSKYGSPFCEFGEDFSDQSPFHGKFEVNGTSLNPMEDSSSSVEIILEIPPKKQVSSPPPPQQSSTSGAVPTPFHPPAKQGVAMAEASHHMHHHQHYQSRHVLSSLCAHPHLSIKESAGEAMISEEISDDTQGESDEEERGEGKLLEDSEEEEVELAEVSGGSTPHRCGDATTPSAEQRAVGAQGARCENGEEPKCNGAQEEPAAGNTLKLGQQVLSSSTPDSSHFAHTDSSVMELSWSEDLDLMPSESEV